MAADARKVTRDRVKNAMAAAAMIGRSVDARSPGVAGSSSIRGTSEGGLDRRSRSAEASYRLPGSDGDAASLWP